MEDPVSVFIPFYSRSSESGLRYLKRAIESVLKQSDANWSLTVVDDCSPIEGVKSFVASFSDPRVSYHLNEKNLGQAGNWNVCKKLCKTTFMTILHADDELLPNYLQEMRPALESRADVAALYCQAEIINENNEVISSFVDYIKKFIAPSSRSGETVVLQGEAGLIQLLHGNFIMCPTVMYRLSLVADLDFTDRWRSIPDLSYWVKLLFSSRKMTGIASVCFRYRRHSESCTAVVTKSTEIFEEEVDFYAYVLAEAKKYDWFKAAKVAEKKRIVKLRISYFMLIDFFRLDWLASFQKLRFLKNIV